MRIADLDLLVIPGWRDSEPEHWQSRWQARMSTARRVSQPDFDAPHRDVWAKNIADAVLAATRPVVFIAHSVGVLAAIEATAVLTALGPRAQNVIGAYLVAPPADSVAAATTPLASFAGMHHSALPFPSVLVASRSDPFCAYDEAESLAQRWGSELVDAGDAGHLNVASGHGPWPEGLLRLAAFLKSLDR
ncbi:MAG: serine hydrolase family protein [Myxococcales bacterium]|nr:serine hydrolase family protein [Myxococcales bacterium]